MGYTYDEFMSAANSAGLTKAFTEQDLQVAQKNPEYGFSLLSLMKDRSKATTAEQQLIATEAANQLRKNYGIYSTGTAGAESTYAPSYGSKITGTMDAIDSYGPFQYANQEGYQKLLDSVANPEPFSYDPESDPSYNAYAKAYMREGERASADALAKAAAATGGRPSSYAVSAAQQAANYYAAQMADALPTLEQNAYSRYLSDINNRVTALNAMNTDKQFAYTDWLQRYNMMQNSLNNYQTQDATDYQRYLDTVADQQWQKTFDYNKGRDMVADQQWQKTFDYNKGQDTLDRQGEQESAAKSELVTLITNTGYRPTEKELAAAGMSQEQADAYLSVYNKDLSAGSSGSATGNGTVKKYSYDTHGYTEEQIKDLQRAAGIKVDGIWGPDTQAAYEKLVLGSDEPGDNLADEFNPTLYDGWDAGDWEGFFAMIRQSEGKASAEETLKQFTSKGLIPTNMVVYAAIGARGGQMGH